VQVREAQHATHGARSAYAGTGPLRLLGRAVPQTQNAFVAREDSVRSGSRGSVLFMYLTVH